MKCPNVCTLMYGCRGLTMLTSPVLGTGVPGARDVFTAKNAPLYPRRGGRVRGRLRKRLEVEEGGGGGGEWVC